MLLTLFAKTNIIKETISYNIILLYNIQFGFQSAGKTQGTQFLIFWTWYIQT